MSSRYVLRAGALIPQLIIGLSFSLTSPIPIKRVFRHYPSRSGYVCRVGDSALAQCSIFEATYIFTGLALFVSHVILVRHNYRVALQLFLNQMIDLGEVIIVSSDG
jgi:hypothetical protein